jgi:glycosyltransferase involved in cell wall biosynthesis
MRVAILSHNAPSGDAIGDQVAAKVCFFAGRGAEVRVFVESDIRLHPEVRPFAHFATAGTVSDTDRAYLACCDLIVAEFGQYYPLLDVLTEMRPLNARVVFDYHGVTPPELWGLGHNPGIAAGNARTDLIRTADAVLVHSTFVRDELAGRTGYPRNRVVRLALPIDTGWFTPGDPRKSLADRLGLPGRRFLLFVGRVAPNKDVPLLVEAVAHLRDGRPEVHAVVIGDTSGPYAREWRRCLRRAEDLGVADRVHLMGHVDAATLRDAYRSADVLVMPSRHEGFCLPVREANACGLTAVAARTSALPETLGRGGFGFRASDALDLARRVRLLLPSSSPRLRGERKRLRIAIVAPRYGDGFAGGAERSLRTIARALVGRGYAVTVFTTCSATDGRWRNDLREGAETIDGIEVRRFRIDRTDAHAFASADAHVRRWGADTPDEVAETYWAHSIRSARLIDAIDGFEALIAGPYLAGLTADVLRRFGDRVLLVPCFHDEPFARVPYFRDVLGRCGGVLYHTRAEMRLAHTTLGFNHPNSHRIGTWLESAPDAVPRTSDRPYLLYLGRYSDGKGVPRLVRYCERFGREHPGLFRFGFAGQGDVPIPSAEPFHDHGFVDESAKQSLLAGAAALVQLSRNESLSLTCLEAWSRGVPVIGDVRCAAIREHLDRCGGGEAIGGYADFAALLCRIANDPDGWRERGGAGRQYVRREFGSADRVAKVVVRAIQGLSDIPATARKSAASEARRSDPAAWQAGFTRFIDRVLRRQPIRPEEDIRPPAEQADLRTLLREMTRPDNLTSALPPESWPTGLLGRLKEAVRRRLLGQLRREFLDPLVWQQTRLNRAVADALAELLERLQARPKKRRSTLQPRGER